MDNYDPIGVSEGTIPEGNGTSNDVRESRVLPNGDVVFREENPDTSQVTQPTMEPFYTEAGQIAYSADAEKVAYVAAEEGMNAATAFEKTLKREHETGLTETQEFNRQILEGLLEKYPHALQRVTLPNGKVVAIFDDKILNINLDKLQHFRYIEGEERKKIEEALAQRFASMMLTDEGTFFLRNAPLKPEYIEAIIEKGLNSYNYQKRLLGTEDLKDPVNDIASLNGWSERFTLSPNYFKELTEKKSIELSNILRAFEKMRAAQEKYNIDGEGQRKAANDLLKNL